MEKRQSKKSRKDDHEFESEDELLKLVGPYWSFGDPCRPTPDRTPERRGSASVFRWGVSVRIPSKANATNARAGRISRQRAA